MPKKTIMQADFLVEILTEELPPKALPRLAASFLNEIKTNLTKAKLNFAEAKFFATPRRLAVFIKNLAATQPEIRVERKGPAFDKAYDAHGKPTPACLGFAGSCGVTPEKLIKLETPQGAWVAY